MDAAAQSGDMYEPWRADWLRKAEEATPKLIESVKKPIAIVELVKDSSAFQGFKCIPAAGRDIEQLKKISLKNRKGFILDFGEHITGHFSFSLHSLSATPDAPTRLKFIFAETPSELGVPFDPMSGRLSGAWFQEEAVTIITIPDLYTLPRRLAFRYVKVEPLALPPGYDYAFDEVYCTAVTSASGKVEPLPETVDPKIRAIDKVALATLKECMQTVYEDGPKRDQRLWIGDLYLEALGNSYSFRQHDLTKRCLYLLAGLSGGNGYLHATVFERPKPAPQKGQFLLEYALLFNVTLLDYVRETGDKATAEDLWPVVLRQLDIARKYLKPDGLIDFERAQKEWWVFIDWKNGLHKEVALQGVISFALQNSYELARLMGRERDMADVPEMIKKMNSAARTHFYDKKSGFFIGRLSPQVSYASQIWMTLAGVPSKKEAARALMNLETHGDVCRPGTPYMYHYYIQALLDAGLGDVTREKLIEYWGGMVDRGADTFWEAYDPQNDFISPYDFYLKNSYCHAWSCTPVYFIRKYPEIFK